MFLLKKKLASTLPDGQDFKQVECKNIKITNKIEAEYLKDILIIVVTTSHHL